MIAIVTGASSGIGREFVRQIDSKNFDEIWLVARRKERLEELSQSIKSKSKIFALELTEDESFEIIKKKLEEENPQVGLLVNAAGLGYPDYFKDLGLYKNAETIRVNSEALTKMTSLVLPYCKEGSAIINIGSVAAFIPQPKFATYAASKSYVLSFSRALNRELRDQKISVSCLCPNPVNTEFFRNSKKSQANKIKSLGLEDIEKLVAKSLRLCHKKDLVTNHPLAGGVKIVSKILPHSFVMWLEKLMKMY
jgi:short-subunit dehydrogenase